MIGDDGGDAIESLHIAPIETMYRFESLPAVTDARCRRRCRCREVRGGGAWWAKVSSLRDRQYHPRVTESLVYIPEHLSDMRMTITSLSSMVTLLSLSWWRMSERESRKARKQAGLALARSAPCRHRLSAQHMSV